MKVQVVSGSARMQSLTKRVADYLYNELKRRGEHEVGLIDVGKYKLPPVEKVFDAPETTPDHLHLLAKKMFNADAFILVSPEYNGGYSPAMKNLFDHFPKQEHKVFGIVTASPGALGGIRAAMQLQNLVYGLFGIGSPKMLIVPEVDKKFTSDGELMDQGFFPTVQHFMDEFLWLSQAVAYTKEKQCSLA